MKLDAFQKFKTFSEAIKSKLFNDNIASLKTAILLNFDYWFNLFLSQTLTESISLINFFIFRLVLNFPPQPACHNNGMCGLKLEIYL